MKMTIAFAYAAVVTIIKAAIAGGLFAVVFCLGLGALLDRYWPLGPNESAGPHFAHGMAMMSAGAIGFTLGMLLGAMTWAPTWRRAKMLVMIAPVHS